MTSTRRKPTAALKTITLGSLLDFKLATRDHLVAPWLRQCESAMLWADSGQGKTMLALSLALAVAGGGELLGWSATTPRKVLYVDGEMHIGDLQERLALLAGAVTGCDLEAARRNLTVLSRQHQHGDVTFPDLAKEEGRNCILQEARRVSAELVILDNFSTLAEVSDENEASAMSPVLAFLLRLKQDERACILVHHSNKSGEAFRGSSKLAATFEVIIGLKRTDGSRATSGTNFTLEWTKYRGQPTAATRAFEASFTSTDGPPRWTCRAALSEEISVLLEAVESCAYGSQNAVAEALAWDKTKVSKVKNKAMAAGKITRERWEMCLAASAEGAGEGVAQDF
ncbi:AAA family ATPase [Lichenicoccus roseus]|uniref:AAA family ATPase n=1 Tax=Lichenicoccus roseus TaxID=2683649 RepID=A0A5R9J2Q9_9PROT|nr:AAA family ATPase [Lichenicoccus roseus]TLU71259.1 AAA family ATPase [Lichenicoccus roseus]